MSLSWTLRSCERPAWGGVCGRNSSSIPPRKWKPPEGWLEAVSRGWSWWHWLSQREEGRRTPRKIEDRPPVEDEARRGGGHRRLSRCLPRPHNPLCRLGRRPASLFERCHRQPPRSQRHCRIHRYWCFCRYPLEAMLLVFRSRRGHFQQASWESAPESLSSAPSMEKRIGITFTFCESSVTCKILLSVTELVKDQVWVVTPSHPSSAQTVNRKTLCILRQACSNSPLRKNYKYKNLQPSWVKLGLACIKAYLFESVTVHFGKPLMAWGPSCPHKTCLYIKTVKVWLIQIK